MTEAARRWADALRGWAIPEEILAAAPESPYGFPTEIFRRRAERSTHAEPSATLRRAAEALPRAGTILDVGVGAGATSLPLAGRASRITGVDQSGERLDAFREAASTRGAEVVHTVEGSWPEVAGEVEPADVVLCGHVLYNVQELVPFVVALTEQARRRVAVEITDRHPWAWMNDLWPRFHGLERPDRPTADDAEAALVELGLELRREDFTSTASGGFERPEEAIALVRRRLCLAPDREGELVEALGPRLAERDGLWSAGPPHQVLVTLWWDVRAAR